MNSPAMLYRLLGHSLVRHIGITMTLAALCSTALAQFVWLDEKGNKQFSDQPPPASVPKSRILKSSSVPAYNPYAGTPDEKTTQSQSTAEKEMAFKKRQSEQSAKEKKDAEEAKTAATKADNCKRMSEYKQSLDSGQRISQTDEKGARGFMSDEKRAEEQKMLSQKMGDC